MRRAERVVFAFGALGETGQPAALANGADAVAPAGQDLVRIGLMADIPDQPVMRRVEDVVQRHGQLDHAEPRAEMAAGDRDRVDQLGAQLVGDLPQIRLRAAAADRPGPRSDRAAASGWRCGLAFYPRLGSSRSAVYDEPCNLSQKFRSLLEQIKMGHRLSTNKPGLGARPLDPEDRDEGGLARGGVGADRLPGLGGRAFDIEQIVGDLEREAEIVRITAQRGAPLAGRLARESRRPRRRTRSARRSSSAAAG